MRSWFAYSSPFLFLFAALAALQALDVATTHHILATGGYEANPLSATLIEAHGAEALWLQKAAALLVVGGLLFIAHRHASRHGYARAVPRASLALVPVAAYPALHNAGVILG